MSRNAHNLFTTFCRFGGSLPHIRRICISGGNMGAIRCIRTISAPTAELPADKKCRFSGFSPASRHAVQR